MTTSTEVHRYRPTSMPALESIVAVGVTLQVLLTVASGASLLGLAFSAPGFLGMYVWLRWGSRIELTPFGVRAAMYEAGWDEIDRIEKRRPFRIGPSYDMFVLKEPKPMSRALSVRGRYDRVPLGFAWANWRETAIRDDIERWAPHLLHVR